MQQSFLQSQEGSWSHSVTELYVTAGNQQDFQLLDINKNAKVERKDGWEEGRGLYVVYKPQKEPLQWEPLTERTSSTPTSDSF